MELQGVNETHAQLRKTVFSMLPHIQDLDQSDREDFAFDYWDRSVRYRIAAYDIEGGWHRTQVAILGEQAFEGPDRICRGHVEGEPVGLTCSAAGGIKLINLLYYALRHSGEIVTPATPPVSGHAWDEFFPSGRRIAHVIGSDTLLAYLAGIQAMTIAGHVNTRRIRVH